MDFGSASQTDVSSRDQFTQVSTNTYLCGAVKGSNRIPQTTMVSRDVSIERTFRIFISSLVYYIQKNTAVCDLSGVWSWDWFANQRHVPVQCNGYSDGRGWRLDEKKRMYLVKCKFFLRVEYATAYGYLIKASTHHPITLIHRLKRCHMTSIYTDSKRHYRKYWSVASFFMTTPKHFLSSTTLHCGTHSLVSPDFSRLLQMESLLVGYEAQCTVSRARAKDFRVQLSFDWPSFQNQNCMVRMPCAAK